MSGPLKKYRVVRGGVETVMKLNDADAERLGVGRQQAEGEVSTIEPVEPVEGAGPATKAATAQNKARTAAANKGGRRRAPAPPEGDGAGAPAGRGTVTDGPEPADGGGSGGGGGD